MRYARALLLVLIICQVQITEAKPQSYSGFAARYLPMVYCPLQHSIVERVTWKLNTEMGVQFVSTQDALVWQRYTTLKPACLNVLYTTVNAMLVLFLKGTAHATPINSNDYSCANVGAQKHVGAAVGMKRIRTYIELCPVKMGENTISKIGFFYAQIVIDWLHQAKLLLTRMMLYTPQNLTNIQDQKEKETRILSSRLIRSNIFVSNLNSVEHIRVLLKKTMSVEAPLQQSMEVFFGINSKQSYSGFAARYRKNLMDRVATNRGIPHEDCMIAATYEPINAWVTVTGLRSKVSRRCIVVDVPAAHDRKHIEQRGIVVELSYEAALDICLSVRQSPRECPVRITR